MAIRAYVPGSGWQPGAGHLYLGMSVTGNGDISAWEASTGPLGVHRTFFQWADDSSEDAFITDDHANKRVPWVSFKPPGPWADVASGVHDNDLHAKATRYAGYARPVIVTFHHEPEGDGPPADWAAAWSHIYDVFEAQTGLANVVFAPVLMEWSWNPASGRNPADWLTADVLSRAPFVGIDVYEPDTGGETMAFKIGRVLDWVLPRGHVIGIGECGVTGDDGDDPAQNWADAWQYMVTQAGTNLLAVSYFNSTLNSTSSWPLDQTPQLLDEYAQSARSAVAVRLP